MLSKSAFLETVLVNKWETKYFKYVLLLYIN